MATKKQWDSIRYFRPEEFDDPDKVSYSLLVRLDNLRTVYGSPITISSDYRPLADWSSHYFGRGVDIPCETSRCRFNLVQAAFRVGFSRIGVYDRHVHLDVETESPQRVLWLGVSK